MSEMLINGTDLSTDDVYYTKPKINSSGGKNVGILNNKYKKTLCISTPLMLTWGINENDFEGRLIRVMIFRFNFLVNKILISPMRRRNYLRIYQSLKIRLNKMQSKIVKIGLVRR